MSTGILAELLRDLMQRLAYDLGKKKTSHFRETQYFHLQDRTESVSSWVI
jgi:hypothetical protein